MLQHRYHRLCPTKASVRVAIVYKNFAHLKGISHVGLGVSAMNNARVLQSHGYQAEVWPLLSVQALRERIEADREQQHRTRHVPLSHVLISAVWLSTADVSALVHDFPDIDFCVVSHSNIGFLQAEPNAVKLLREQDLLAVAAPNFQIGSNSRGLVDAWGAILDHPMALLPNMYFLEGPPPFPKPWYLGSTLKIGTFGATRVLKNLLTASAAALIIAKELHAPHLEFWFSGGRPEGGAHVVQAMRELYAGVPRVAIVENPWQSWPEFRQTIGSMNLLLQPSFTESFNVVTADGVAGGVPSVVSPSIDWTPEHWRANADDAIAVARVGASLLTHPGSAQTGFLALVRHNIYALRLWRRFLLVPEDES